MMFCPQFNKSHRKLLSKLYTPSCELQRMAEEAVNNEKRLIEHQNRIDMYKDKRVSKEYEIWLDFGRG